MSISTLQEKFFNKGCGTAIIGLAAVAMVASMFTRFGGSSQGANAEGSAGTVATVGAVPITAALIQEQASQMQSQAMQQRGLSSPPDAEAQAHGLVNATQRILQEAAVQALLAQQPPTDAEIQAVATAQIEQGISGARAALQKQGKLKPGASDAELQAALKDQLAGKTLAQARADAPKNLLKAYKDPKTKTAVLDRVGGALLVERYGEKAVGSDQALRDSYKTYVVRRVFLSSTSGAKDSPEVRAAKVEADLKAGKSFDAEMDTASNDPVTAGKKAHDFSDSVPATAFDGRPELASLKGKAPGATTSVVDAPGGKAIYQLVSVSNGLPKDFEKTKGQLRTGKIQSVGAAETEKRIKALLAGGDVRWQSAGYKALGAVGDATTSGFVFDQVAAKKALAIAQESLKSDNGADRRLAAMALLALTDPQTSVAPKTPDVLASRRAAVEAAQSAGIEDAALSLELVGLYGDAKDGARATATLIAASKANDRYDTGGENTFREIASKALDLQSKGVLTKAQLQSVQAQQAMWSAARADNAKAATQAKSDDASEKAANEAEIARQKAEAEKVPPASNGGDAASKAANDAEVTRQKAEASKTAVPKPSGSTVPPAASGKGR